MSVNCPKCDAGEGQVIDSRLARGIRERKRRCAACGHRWKTIESSGMLPDQQGRAAILAIEKINDVIRSVR
jgi:transcriptional regulator NrdR family protein